MRTQWRKVLGDLRQHRYQVLAVTTVLALGTTGFVAALNAYTVLRREIAQSYRSSLSPDIAFWIDRVEPRHLELLRSRPGVAAVEARRNAATKIAGANPGEWLPVRLVIVPQLRERQVGAIHQHGATWPAEDTGVFIEQSSMPLLPRAANGSAEFRLPGGGTITMPIRGSVHDTAVAPGIMERLVYAYATPVVAAQLGQNPELDQLVVRLESRGSGAGALANSLGGWLTANDARPHRIELLPNAHPHASLMAALLQLLRVFAMVAFLYSAALAGYVVSVFMKREVRQVGIMKTIGATSWQLARQYLALLAPVLLAATVIAFSCGTLLGRWLIDYTAGTQNIDVATARVPLSLVLRELILSLAIPLCAMALPIVRSARRTAREALQDPGISVPPSRAVSLARRLGIAGSARWTFAFRNTFRRPWRFAVALLALTLGALVLLAASNHYESLMHVIDANLAARGHDFQVNLQKPIARAELESIAAGIPEIQIAEAWQRTGGEIVAQAQQHTGPGGFMHAGANAARTFQLSGYPSNSRLRTLPIQEGRWPQPEEQDAVVVTRPLQARIPEARVGAELVLQFRERRTKVRVVGLVDEIGAQVIYVPAPTFEAMTGTTGLASELRVKANDGAVASVVAALDQALLDARQATSLMMTRADIRAAYEEHFADFVNLCSIVALAVALVGGTSLVAFASLSVIERTREIGVIRAIGATPQSVVTLFLAEGAIVAALSVLLAVALAFPASVAFNNFTAKNALLIPIPLVLSRSALALVALGLAVVVVAIWLAVRRIVRMPAREALAYE